jgi:hypothetical protein
MSAFHIMSRLALVLALAPLSGTAVAADDEVVTTASRAKLPTAAELAKARADEAARPAITSAPMTTAEQIAAWHANAPKLNQSDDATDEVTGPRKIHGEASVSIGTGGYRSLYMSSLMPIGENGTLGIAIAQTDFGRNGGYSRAGYGRNGYGAGGYSGRGGTSQSIALSLDMSGQGHNTSGTPEGCAPGFRDGDRYVEPLWVTQMRGNRTCETTTTSTQRYVP